MLSRANQLTFFSLGKVVKEIILRAYFQLIYFEFILNIISLSLSLSLSLYIYIYFLHFFIYLFINFKLNKPMKINSPKQVLTHILGRVG